MPCNSNPMRLFDTPCDALTSAKDPRDAREQILVRAVEEIAASDIVVSNKHSSVRIVALFVLIAEH